MAEVEGGVMTPTPDILVLVSARELAELRGQRPPDIEAICRDYAERWIGKDWSLMDDDDEAELRIQAHRWLKCWAAVTSADGKTP